MLKLRNRARNLQQGNQEVTQYFNSLIKQELELFNTCEWKDPKDAMMFREMVERDRVIDFLVGLNNDLDDVRGRIAGMKPLPSIKETFANVRREESRKRVMMGETLVERVEISALVCKANYRNTFKSNKKPLCV